MEQFIFSVDAQTDRAVQKLQHITKLMANIEKIRLRGVDDYSTTNQKDMDKNMRSMAELTARYKDVNKELEEIQRNMRAMADSTSIPKGATKEQVRAIQQLRDASEEQAQAAIKQQQALQMSYHKTLRSFRQLASFQQNYSKNFKPVFNSNDLYNLPGDPKRARKIMEAMASQTDGVQSKLDGVISKIKEVNKLDRRTESLSRRAQASKYMSYQQAQNFSSDYGTATHGYKGMRSENLRALTSLGMERKRITNQIKDIETNEQVTQQEIDKKIALQQTIEAMDKEIEARMDLNRALDRTTKNVEKYNERLQEGVEVKPERGTMRGMMYERAPAIGLALGGTIGFTFGSLYQRGDSVKNQMRDDVIGIGQRTGSTDWRTDIRDNALNAGLQDRLGFTGQEMLAFQNNYLSNRGFSGMDDLNSAMKSQAEFSRVTGTDSNMTRQFFDSIFSAASVNGGSLKDIQNAFVGAIKQSGMEGREESQIKALEGILGEVSRGRKMSEGELKNVMGLQSILANSGNESLRGERGGQFLADLNSGIRGGMDDPMTRLMFGQGTKYQGLAGGWELSKQLEKGISDVDNVRTIGRIAESFGGSEDEQNRVAERFIRGNLGVDASTDQIEGIMDLYRSGQLSQENLEKVLEGNMATGAEESQSKLENYQGQKEAMENQSAAVTEKQSVQLNDFGDIIKEANSAMGNWNALIYATTASLVALSGAIIATTGSFGISALVRRGAAGTYRGAGANFPTPMDRARGLLGGGGGAGGGFFGFGGGGGNRSAGGPRGGAPGGGTILGPDGRPLPPSQGAGTAGANGGGKWNKLLKGMGSAKVWAPIAAVTGVMSIASAPKGEKASATGGVAGGLAGGWAGAKGGALIGSAFGPVGTAIGGILGGIGGALVGSGAGSWLGGKIGGLFGKKEGSDLKEQVDRENASKKDQTESKRSSNIIEEKDLLSREEKLLQEQKGVIHKSQVLASASAGGLYAAGGGTGGATNTSYNAKQMSATVSQGNSNADKVWNFFAQKGFSPEAAAGIMGNLQQESGLNPTAVNSSSGAFGIGQWLGGRKTNLFNYAKNNGMDPNSIDAQLNFMWQELNGGDPTTASILNKKHGGLDGLMGMTDVNAATNAFEGAFERSGGSAMQKRRSYANDFYNQFGGAQWANSTNMASAANSNGVLKVDSTINVKVTGDEKISDKIKNNKDLRAVAEQIQDKVYGSMAYYSKDMVRRA